VARLHSICDLPAGDASSWRTCNRLDTSHSGARPASRREAGATGDGRRSAAPATGRDAHHPRKRDRTERCTARRGGRQDGPACPLPAAFVVARAGGREPPARVVRVSNKACARAVQRSKCGTLPSGGRRHWQERSYAPRSRTLACHSRTARSAMVGRPSPTHAPPVRAVSRRARRTPASAAAPEPIPACAAVPSRAARRNWAPRPASAYPLTPCAH